ncbi:MAG TPA: 4Fe-4S double cluster binding domain-containing protein [bacterium]|nr:4Fe-4S double cluster binding domain-containing protein [bacterium]
MDSRALKDEIRQIAPSFGADLVGFVDITTQAGNLTKAGFTAHEQYECAISIGIPVINSIADQIGTTTTASAAYLYRLFCYDIINNRLNEIAFSIASHLEKAGFRSFPVPSTHLATANRIQPGLFSHKATAYLAGLGWIGKSCLLVTPQFGPRLRLTTVLTTAQIGDDPKPMENRCGECTRCLEICPAKAFTGREFAITDPLEVRMDAAKCDEHLKKKEETVGVRVCGLCVTVCPYGNA